MMASILLPTLAPFALLVVLHAFDRIMEARRSNGLRKGQ
jgi:hypothetical protein